MVPSQKVIQEEVMRLVNQNDGVVTPEEIVEVARNPKHPLHDAFEWDDSIAAEKWRLDQARVLIRTVQVVITVRDIEITGQGLIRDPRAEGKDQGYVLVERIRSNAEQAQRAMENELIRVSSSAARAREIAFGLGLQSEIEAKLAEAIAAH